MPKNIIKRFIGSKSKIEKEQQGNDTGSISYRFLEAIDKLDIKKSRELLEKGADPNKNCPLCSVSKHRRGSITQKIEMIDLLLEYGADINGDGYSNPLCCAAINYQSRSDNHFENIMSHLLEKGADINGDGKNVPLNKALHAGTVASASKNSAYFLLRKGAAVDIADEDGDTPYDEVSKIKSWTYRQGTNGVKSMVDPCC